MSEAVDLDRLADFVGGALDGTADAAEVRRLITDDPAWAAAYTDLVTALDAVADDLVAYAAHRPTLPTDVAARLDTIFGTRGTGSDPTRTAGRTEPQVTPATAPGRIASGPDAATSGPDRPAPAPGRTTAPGR